MILLILKLKNQECVCMLTIVHPFEIKFIETFFNGCSPVRIFHSNPTTLVHRQPNPLYLHQKLKILQEKQLPYKSS